MKYPAQSDLWRLDAAIHAKPVTNGQSRVLGRFKQLFPLTLFRDRLIIEELRIVHVKQDGPWVEEVNSIMATDIACVNCATGIFFGSVHIKSLTGGPEIFVDNLARKDVLMIRSLVEGIALSSREGLRINHETSLDEERENFLRAGAVHYG